MRYPLLIMLCLLSLVSAGPVTAARATGHDGCGDVPSISHGRSGVAADCDRGQDTAHKCNHDACCGVHLVAIAAISDFSTSHPPRLADVASITKHLTGSGGETLLDPPRA